VPVHQDVDAVSHVTDRLFEVPVLRWRFGMDPVVGLVPWFGDLLTTVLSLYVLMSAVRTGVPRITLVRMGLNIIIDLLVGSLPVVGDLFDAWWKANTRNVALMRRRAADGESVVGGSLWDWLFVGLVVSMVVVAFLVAATITWWLISQVVSVLRP
jgi:hypothetical protein